MAARKEWKDYAELAPAANSALLALSKAVHDSELDPKLVELVKLRASQINGCAFCIQYHATAARKLNIDSDRLQLLSVWRDTSIFSKHERAALRWTERLTLISSESGISDDEYERVKSVFADAEIAHLTAAIALINAWNRIAGAYQFSPLLPSNALETPSAQAVADTVAEQPIKLSEEH
jgi:AhpD family alkylhydroperoxidase